MTVPPIDTPPLRSGVPEQIRECFCVECGRVASSWFHSDFVLFSDGFKCKWCTLPDMYGEPPPK